MKVLIIRFSSIGDIVLTTPVIRCLHQQKKARVDVLIKAQFKGLLSPNPYVQQVFSWVDEKADVLIRQLKDQKYDYVIDLHNNLRSLRIKKALSCPSKSFFKANFAKFLAVNFKCKGMLPSLHIVDRYMKTVEFLGVENDQKGLDFFIDTDTKITHVLPKQYLVYALGGTYFTKRMPPEKIVALCTQTHQNIVFLGGSAERAQADEILQACEEKKVGSRIFNLCAELSIMQSAKVIQSALGVITHDTGMMHIASALKKKVFSIWGSTIAEFGMTPYMADSQSKMFRVEGLKCRPCSKLGHNQCPKKHFKCMRQINTLEIAKALNVL